MEHEAPPTTLREAVRSYLERRLSRRSFVATLGRLGLAAPAAGLLAGRLDAHQVADEVADEVTAEDGTPPAAGSPRRDLTGGELTAEVLRAWEVAYVFGVGGSEEVGFLDALVDRLDLHYVLALHEGSALAMADGYARTSGRTGFVNLHSVAGSAYALGPLTNAAKDWTPLVVTAGRQSTDLRGSNAFLEAVDLHTLPRGYTRWSWDLTRADALPATLRRAFLLAGVPPGGPTFLTVSKDLWEERVPEARIITPERTPIERHLRPDPSAVVAAVDHLLAASAPLLVAGRELALFGGTAELIEIAELLGAPVMADVPASHSPLVFPTSHPHYLGMLGAEGDLQPEFDLFWSVGGTMFTLFAEPPTPLVPSAVTALHTSLDPGQIGRNQPVDLALPGATGSTLSAVRDELRRRPPAVGAGSPVAARAADTVRRHALRRERLTAAARRRWDADPIAPERLAVELDRRLDPRAVVVTEAVTSDLYVWRYISFGERRHLTSAGGCLGWGLGAAIGAKIGQPDRQVALLVGDGAFHFGVQALWSAARYEVPIAVVIWNNGAYQANRRALHRYGGRAAATGKYIGCWLGDPAIDPVMVARGYGVDGARVSAPDRLGAALDRCFEAVAGGRPFVLDVTIEPRFGGAASTWHDAFSVARGIPRRS